ncbi:MAG: site-2 protease family protein [Christensenellaceae bacterium]|jgi:Zn-dependent protease
MIFSNALFQNWSSPSYWMGVLYSLPAILLALTVHETAHAYAAYKAGDPTAKNLGRMTLDPFKHIDPVGLICLIFFRFGWAKPVPVNPRNFKNYKRDNILVSLAGIITNLICSFVFFGIWFGLSVGLGITNEVFQNIMQWLVIINITLSIFNILPIPPLDGFQVLSTFLSRRAATVVKFLNRYGFIILIILLITGILSDILNAAVNGLFNAYLSFFSLFVG